VHRAVPTLLLALALLVLAFALWPRQRAARIEYVASWSLTPGVVNPDVTQASIRSTICVPGWTRTIRPPTTYTNELKLEQMRAYGSRGGPGDYQEDHLISLELGGDPRDPRNLWPEPRPHAEEVDGTENSLREGICSGAMTLAEGQRRIVALKHTSG
jgi:hypothetical protein